MTSENPYAPGTSTSLTQPLDIDDASHRCLMALKSTRPWVRFIGILTTIVATLFGLAGIVALFAQGIGIPIAVACIYAAFSVLYGFAAKFLLFYAGAITRAEASLKLDDIANALEHQKSFWKLIGICTACVLGLYLILIPIALLLRF